MASSEPALSFGAVLAILGAATVVGVGAAVVLGILILIPVVLAVVLGIGVVYILATGTSEPPAAATAAASPEEEPFEDPVEEADRLDSSGAPLETPAPPAGPASDGDDAK